MRDAWFGEAGRELCGYLLGLSPLDNVLKHTGGGVTNSEKVLRKCFLETPANH